MREGPDHYSGIVAECYDLFDHAAEEEEFAFYRRLLEDAGEPALVAACGTGRILLPLFEAGFEVQGFDASGEMLAICRTKAERRGLLPTLHEQRMEALHLSRCYRTILVPYGSFQALVELPDAAAALERFREHLVPGGVLALALFVPADEDPRRRWRIRHVGERPDGARVFVHEAIERDRGTGIETGWFRYEVYAEGRLVRTEMRSMRQRLYREPEIRRLAERAGFASIRASGDYTDAPFGAGHTEMIVRARRPPA